MAMTNVEIFCENWNKGIIKYEIMFALDEFQKRGLKETSKWLAELSWSLEVSPSKPDKSYAQTHYGKPNIFDENKRSYDRSLDLFNRAKCYFDLDEYERAGYLLRNSTDDLSVFLHLYSRYMATVKKHLYKCTVNHTVAARSMGQNEELRSLKNELSQKVSDGTADTFIAYLYALVLKKSAEVSGPTTNNEIIDALRYSVKKCPMNWSAWNLMSNYVPDVAKFQSLDLPKHWIRDFFMAQTNVDLVQANTAIKMYSTLRKVGFEKNIHVITKEAIAQYDRRNFEEATSLLESLRADDPYRLEDMDILSNMYYVNGQKAELANLAHHCNEIDKYRVETCCVIGNYYSIRSAHDKAIQYFQRALKINPNYLSAWTLIGHEYTEVKNTSAAIQAYRNAIDLNRKDYRAWYGLGQAYEILRIFKFSLYYYKQAQRLRAFDSRMAMAVGETYELLNRPEDAKMCYRKAVAVGDMEGQANYKIARLFLQEKNNKWAAHYYQQFIQQAEDQGIMEGSSNHHEAYIFLARHYLEVEQNLQQAALYANKCFDFSEVREEGKKILRQVEALQLASSVEEVEMTDGQD